MILKIIHTPLNKIKKINKELSKPSKLAERTIFLENKNGKSYVRDEFVGMHVQRPSITSAFEEVAGWLCSKIFKHSD